MIMLVFSIALASTACETPETGMVGEPPEDDELQEANRPSGPRKLDIAKEEPATRDYPEPLFGADVWPYVEEGITFELTWGDRPAALEVRENPDLNSKAVGSFELSEGDSIPWRASWVAIYEPAVFTAQKQVEFSGSRHAPDTRDHGETIRATVHPGQPVAVYHYAGAATCWVGVDRDILRTSCPTSQDFDGDFSGKTRAEQMHPAKRIWWVYIETSQTAGWIPIDDRVLVDLVD